MKLLGASVGRINRFVGCTEPWLMIIKPPICVNQFARNGLDSSTVLFSAQIIRE